MPLHRAIETYHEILSRPDVAEESHAYLVDHLTRQGLLFGNRPICSVLRPRFLSVDQYRFLQSHVSLLLSAFRKSYDRAIADERFRRQYGLLDWEEELIRVEPGFSEPSPVSRLDAFFVPERGGLRFTEYNAETPAGGAYGDLLTEIFLNLPVMREFLGEFELRPLPVRHLVLRALIRSYREWSGRREKPRVAILDWREVPTYREFTLSAEYFERHGIETVIVDPRDVEYSEGALRADGKRIDLIYKRVLISELVERGGLDHPVVRAVRDGAVCMVNSFRCKILHKKASLAVLSDERNAELFSTAELQAIHATVPWTRVLEERRCQIGGEEVDLVEYVLRDQERLVLKPNDDYGGAGIVLGWEVDGTEWEAAVRNGLRNRFVVQERIPIPTEVYPTYVNGALSLDQRILDTAPFVFDGSFMDGCLTRLSTESLVNVTAGGGSSLATFVVTART